MGCGHITASKKDTHLDVKQIQFLQNNNYSPTSKQNNNINNLTISTNYSSSLSPVKKHTQSPPSPLRKQQRLCSIHDKVEEPNWGEEYSFQKFEKKIENSNTGPVQIEINFNLARNLLSNLNHIKTKNTPITDEYTFQTILGEGSYSKVFKAVHVSSKKRVAIKMIPHHSNKQEIAVIEKEALILSKLDHPNIVKIYDLFRDSENMYLVTEYCPGGCLKDVIKQSDTNNEDNAQSQYQQLLFWMFQVTSAISYCHNNHILHRDLKPENILFSNKQRDIVKIIDFGFSLNTEEIKSKETIKGTPYYMAPEVVFSDHMHCNEKVDVWSVGVIFYYLFFKKKPFKGKDLTALFSNIKTNKEIFKDIDQKIEQLQVDKEILIDFLRKMLDKNPTKRISMFEALQHHIFDPIKNLLSCKKSIIENIINFSEKNKKCRNQALRKIIVKFLFYKVINQRKFLDILHCYYSLDVNFNGFIEKQYMLFVINQIYQNPKEAKEICDSIYTNEQTLLSFSDFFIRALNFDEDLLSEINLYHAFKILDPNDTGVLKKDVVEEFIKNALGLENSNDLLKMLDKKSKNILANKNCIFFNDFKELFN